MHYLNSKTHAKILFSQPPPNPTRSSNSHPPPPPEAKECLAPSPARAMSITLFGSNSNLPIPSRSARELRFRTHFLNPPSHHPTPFPKKRLTPIPLSGLHFIHRTYFFPYISHHLHQSWKLTRSTESIYKFGLSVCLFVCLYPINWSGPNFLWDITWPPGRFMNDKIFFKNVF